MPRDSCIVLKVQYPVKLIGTVKVSVKEKVSKILREVVQRFPKMFSRKEMATMRVALMGRLIPNDERLERFKSGDVIMIVKGVTGQMPKCPTHELELLCYSKKYHYMLCHTCWTVQDHRGVSHSESDPSIVSIGDLPEEKRQAVLRDAKLEFVIKTKQGEEAASSGTLPNGKQGAEPSVAGPELDRNFDYRGIPKTIPNTVEGSLALEAAQKNIVSAIQQDDDVCVQNKASMFPLLYAVHNQNDEMVSYLLGKGASPSQRTFTGLTPLIAAAHLGNVNIVSKLLKTGRAHPDSQMKDGTTALIAAASHTTSAQITLLTLLHYDAMVNLARDDGTTALMCAAQIDDYTAVKILLRNGASVAVRQVNGYSALSMAVINSNVETAQVLLGRGAPLCADIKGNTLLALATRHSTPEMVQLLIDQGVDPNQANRNGCTPLALCTSSPDDVDMAGMLLKAGARVGRTRECDVLLHIVLGGASSLELLKVVWPHADPEHIDYRRLIEAAVEYRDKAMLEYIVVRTPKGRSFGTAIVKSIEEHDKKTSQYLTEACSNPDSLRLAFTEALRVKNKLLMQALLANEQLMKPSEEGLMSPLMVVAGETGNSKVVKMLLEMGFDAAEVDSHGRTALHYCKTHKVAFALLRQPDERLQCLDANNESALVHAIRSDDADTVKLLINLGFDSKTVNTDGDSPLHVAAQCGSISTLRSVLLTYKDQFDKGMTSNAKGMTPLMLSCLRGAHTHVLEVLSVLSPSQEVVASALHVAIEHNKVAAVEKLLPALRVPISRFVTTCAKTDNVPMIKVMLTVWDDHCCAWDTVDRLLKEDAKKILEQLLAPLEVLSKLLELKTFTGETLLHMAARYGAMGCVDVLISMGLKVEAADCARKTPVMVAAQHGKLETVQQLVDKHHAKLAVRCKLSRTPAMYGVLSNKAEMLQYFMKPKPKQSKTTAEEQELMEVALTFELEDMVHTLAMFPDS